MNQRQIRSLWTQLRFEYYISGRRLFFDGLFRSGLIMLSYAVETSLKALISEFHNNTIQKAYKSVKNEHSITELYSFCEKYSIIGDVKVSHDFLKFISLNFSRYPSQIEESNRVWFQEHGGVGCYIGDLSYFDDLILQTNNEIFLRTNDLTSNLLVIALRNLRNNESRIFFCQNFHAHAQIPSAFKIIETLPERDITRISQDVITMEKLRFSHSRPGVEMNLAEIIELTKAENYRL